VGAGSAWFQTTRTNRDRTTPLRVVFFGLFTPLQGTLVIGKTLGLLSEDPAIEVDMVGTGQDLPECRRLATENPRVTWHDWVDAGHLPGFVAGHDVCLGIFGTTSKAQAVVPTKVFQGAAAGCAVVTSDTPPQRELLGDAACFVPAGDSQALAATLRQLAGDRPFVEQMQMRARSRAEGAFTPASVAGSLLERVRGGHVRGYRSRT
jgi:glycosyltransferase involved in cell wall biosynthesis